MSHNAYVPPFACGDSFSKIPIGVEGAPVVACHIDDFGTGPQMSEAGIDCRPRNDPIRIAW
jgi:hypothetical protein